MKNDEDIEKAGIEICNNLSLNACLITRGPNGMSYIKISSKDFLMLTGDTVIASFASYHRRIQNLLKKFAMMLVVNN